MNRRWHLKDAKQTNRTLCGRRTQEEGFHWKTATLSTDDIKKFRENPCVNCLRHYK